MAEKTITIIPHFTGGHAQHSGVPGRSSSTEEELTAVGGWAVGVGGQAVGARCGLGCGEEGGEGRQGSFERHGAQGTRVRWAGAKALLSHALASHWIAFVCEGGWVVRTVQGVQRTHTQASAI